MTDSENPGNTEASATLIFECQECGEKKKVTCLSLLSYLIDAFTKGFWLSLFPAVLAVFVEI